MRIITLEEHHASPNYLQLVAPNLLKQPELANRLIDIGEGRISAMDDAGVDMQVLSLSTPGVEQLDSDIAIALSREENDRRGEAVKAYPTRFAGFATLPISVPEAAAAELDRTVTEYGFVGALINGHSRGRYLDDDTFRPIWECAAALGVPIYLHPTPPPQSVIDTWYSGFSEEVTGWLSTAAWGWHIETAVHVLRLIVGGVFDRFPNVQIIVGHLGEGLVAMMPRIAYRLPVNVTGLQRSVDEYLRENVHYTTSGFNYESIFRDLVAQVGIDRIMFSVDYPFLPLPGSREFLEGLPLTDQDRHRIAHGNAQRLLGIPAERA